MLKIHFKLGNPIPPKGYRKLNVGEEIEEPDLFYSPISNSLYWHKSGLRRKIFPHVLENEMTVYIRKISL